MNDTDLISIFSSAWRGLAVRHAEDQQRLARSVEYYRHKLKEARQAEVCRGVIAELCAEGGIAAGGIAGLADEWAFAAFWALLNSPEWARAKDAALLAGSRGEK